jgi:hypothetical protein
MNKTTTTTISTAIEEITERLNTLCASATALRLWDRYQTATKAFEDAPAYEHADEWEALLDAEVSLWDLLPEVIAGARYAGSDGTGYGVCYQRDGHTYTIRHDWDRFEVTA